MKESEAIKELKYDCNELGKAIPCDTSWGCSFENAYGMAIKALEKQMPKKPIRHTAWEDFKCPACGSTEIRPYDTEYSEYDKDCKFEYCSDCGQKLDWSDEE